MELLAGWTEFPSFIETIAWYPLNVAKCLPKMESKWVNCLKYKDFYIWYCEKNLKLGFLFINLTKPGKVIYNMKSSVLFKSKTFS